MTLYAFASGSQGDQTDETDTFTTFDYQEAMDRARKYHMALIAHEYEWSDSELLEDFRPR